MYLFILKMLPIRYFYENDINYYHLNSLIFIPINLKNSKILINRDKLKKKHR